MNYEAGIVKQTEFFTTAELAKKLKMNVQVVTRKVQSGEIRAYKVGKDWRIPELAVHEWLESASNQASGNGKTRGAPKKKAAARQGAAEMPTENRKYFLEYILAQFEPNRNYHEKDVDRIISRYHGESGTIRKLLVAENMIEFSDNSYRRRAGYSLSN
jgi:excisionase family DNA binding protein